MARYWASKNSLPTLTEGEKLSAEYKALVELRDSLKGLTIDQGAPDLGGCFEMLCALQYHYLNFMRVLKKKATRAIPHDAPDERFEAVSYINRVGQIQYFSESAFVERLLGPCHDCRLTWISHLLPFRHKYSAHRERDKPKNPKEIQSLSGELALGALGGWLFCEKYPGAFAELSAKHGDDFEAHQAEQYEVGYIVYQIFIDQGSREFILERDHSFLFEEVAAFLTSLIVRAKMLPRE